ncbi:MAG: hypothetical protein AAB840_01630, partial [Patescibacteria group bacterium]
MYRANHSKQVSTTKEPGRKEPTSYSYEGPLKKSMDIASFYGFRIIPPPDIKSVSKKFYNEDEFYTPLEEKETILNRFFNNEFGNAGFPAMLCYTRRSPVKRTTYLHLEIVGSFKSMADAILLATAFSIIKDTYGKNVCV